MKRSKKETRKIKVSRSIKLLLSTLICVLLSTAINAQFSTLNFEGAKSLQLGQVEFGLNKNSYYSTYSGTTTRYQNSLGTFFRLGVLKQIDLQFSYQRLYYEKLNNGINFVQFGPKISSKNGKIAFKLPFGILFAKNEYGNEEEKKYSTSFAVSPAVIITVVKKKIFELNLTPMSEFYFSNLDEIRTIIGMDIGLGFSSNFDRWSIRPEGRVFLPVENIKDGGFSWTLGLSTAFVIGGK